METPPILEPVQPISEEDDIAFAAEAAANAVAAADAEQQRLDESMLSCRICGQGSGMGRPLLRFLPVDHDGAAARAAPGVLSFTQDIALHIFCGKTASILPNVQRPELEILTKAGLKNKHGIGSEVNAALARTRCAILQQEGTKEKQYYLVREFEAHLAAIRHTHIPFSPEQQNAPLPTPYVPHDPQPHSQTPPPHHSQMHDTQNLNNGSIAPSSTHLEPTAHLVPDGDPILYLQQPEPHVNNHIPNDFVYHFDTPKHQPKTIPVRAGAGRKGFKRPNLLQDGKVRCACGGTHWPPGTARGAASIKSHMITKRHQKWTEQNGLLEHNGLLI